MIGDWKGTVLGVFEGRAEKASYVRLLSFRLSSGRSLRLPEAKKRLLRALSIVPVAVLSKARLLLKAARDRPLASGSFRLAKKRLLRALSIVTVAVLSKARLLPKAARDRRIASGSFRLVCSVSLSASIFAENFSKLCHKEKLC
ncbi:unnamed protein product [Coccothraustes coccothraustes]